MPVIHITALISSPSSMTFNSLLFRQGLITKAVLVLRHFRVRAWIAPCCFFYFDQHLFLSMGLRNTRSNGFLFLLPFITPSKMHSNTRITSKEQQRHHFLLATTATALTASLISLHLSAAVRKHPANARSRREFSMHRESITLDEINSVFSENDFSKAYRMKLTTFKKLLALIRPDLKRDERMGRRAKHPIVKPEIRLALLLRMMAGACAHDCPMAYKISKKTVYSVFHATRHTVDKMFDLPGLPRTFDGLKKIAEDFQVSRTPSSPLPGCVGALDGIAIKIKKPRRKEHPASYFCRKGYYAIPVQAMCDSNHRFLCFSAICHGSTHDSLAHAVSTLGQFLEEGGLMNQYWIAGDEAYVCTNYLVTPVPNLQANECEDAFNFFHSSLRMHIEQSFGMLMKKWSLLKKLEYSVKNSANIVGVAIKLHNFCIDHDRNFEFSTQKSHEDHDEVSYGENWFKEGRHDYLDMVGQSGSDPSTIKRGKLVRIITVRDMQRPPAPGVFISEAIRPAR